MLISILVIGLTITEIRLTKLSSTLPFVNSIFFFGLLNINVVLLLTLLWLIFRNIGKLFLERRSRLLGARLKTKLVVAFLAFSITPTLVLFIISSSYINSSFDKWFSIKVQNTLQASLEITRTYYKNAERTTTHFAEHIADQLEKRLNFFEFSSPAPLAHSIPSWVEDYLNSQRKLLAIHALEFYSHPFGPRVISQNDLNAQEPHNYPGLSLDLLDRVFAGEKVSIIQHMGSGDFIRRLVPVYARHGAPSRSDPALAGILSVGTYLPVSLINKVNEIASVFDDYQGTNPLKYPIKSAYFLILVMITLVIIFVAIWIGLYLARELTVPVERLVFGAHQVGSGNLDTRIEGSGHDELGVLVESFNKMTQDLRENRERLTQASHDLENRKLQLETVLTSIGTAVLVVDREGQIITLNSSAASLLGLNPTLTLYRNYVEIMKGDLAPLKTLVDQAFKSANPKTPDLHSAPQLAQWNLRRKETVISLSGVATPLLDDQRCWGVVAVIDDMTHIVKAQREVAWREVARRIAHEIKNPLTPIKLSAQRLQRRLSHFVGKDAQVLQECTDTIVKHTDELKEMVNEFSNFARFPETSPAPHDLNQVLKEVLSLFSQAHPDIQFELKLEEQLKIFEFDRDQIKRVIINLLDNAVSAIAQGKAHKPSLQGQVRLRTFFNDQLEMVVVTISDNGVGMTEEIRSRVFEPYFSTKKDGTGLGLAIAKRIINDHDGYIRVRSHLGIETEFLIELPTKLKRSTNKKNKLETFALNEEKKDL